MKSEEYKLITPEQFSEWIDDVSKARLKSRDEVLIIGRDLWVKTVGPNYGFSEDEADSMFDKAGTDPRGVVYDILTIRGRITFVHP